MITSLLFFQIAALFLIMGLGFLLVKVRLVKPEDSRVLSMIAIYIIGPCMILKAFQIEFTDTVRTGFLLAAAVAVGVNFILLFVSGLFRRALKLTPVEQASVMYANTGNLVVPLVTAVLGDEWVIYASAFLCVQLVFIWTHAQSLISGERSVSWKKILTNVNVMTIAVGLVMLVTGLRLPAVLQEVCGQLASTMGPVSMIMLGMLLANVDWKRVLTNRRAYFVMGLKMVVVPLIILALFKITGVASLAPEGKTILYVSFMAVITPCASLVTQISQLYRRDPEYASALNVMTTLICIATMPLMTWLYMKWI